MKRENVIENGIITIEQKKRFFQYALDIYTKNLRGSGYGFCALYDSFFGFSSCDFNLIPELKKYKPQRRFYCNNNIETTDEDQFWFPMGDNKKRINICKKILISFPKKINSICPDCYGSGEITTSHEFKHCKTCDGSGKIELK